MGASKLIDRIKKRQEKGLASFDQVRSLLAEGVDADLARVMSADSADRSIKEIARAKELAPKTQGSLFAADA